MVFFCFPFTIQEFLFKSLFSLIRKLNYFRFHRSTHFEKIVIVIEQCSHKFLFVKKRLNLNPDVVPHSAKWQATKCLFNKLSTFLMKLQNEEKIKCSVKRLFQIILTAVSRTNSFISLFYVKNESLLNNHTSPRFKQNPSTNRHFRESFKQEKFI